MLYNIEKERVQTDIDCLTCKYFDKKTKKCGGFGRNCFEYDIVQKAPINPHTKKIIKKEEFERWKFGK